MVVTASQVGLSLPGKLFFGGLTAGTFVLGCWQTQRYFEKIALIEQRQKELKQEPLPLENDLLDIAERSEELQQKQLQKDFRRRFVTGIFRHDEEMYVGLRGPPIGALASSGPASGKSQGGMSSGPQGYFVITPLEVSSNGRTILVNRGWIPRVFLSTDNQGLYDRPRGPTSIVAVRTKAETPRFLVPEHDAKHRRLFWMDLDTMKAWTNNASPSSSPPIPLYIQVKPKDDDGEGLTRKEIVKYPAPPSASSVGEFVTTPAIHVGYAATWFGLAGAGVVMTRKLITRGRG